LNQNEFSTNNVKTKLQIFIELLVSNLSVLWTRSKHAKVKHEFDIIGVQVKHEFDIIGVQVKHEKNIISIKV